MLVLHICICMLYGSEVIFLFSLVVLFFLLHLYVGCCCCELWHFPRGGINKVLSMYKLRHNIGQITPIFLQEFVVIQVIHISRERLVCPYKHFYEVINFFALKHSYTFRVILISYFAILILWSLD